MPTAPEILEQCQRIGKQFGLYDNALFQTEVTRPRWTTSQALADHDRPRRPLHRAARRPRHRPAAPAKLPGIPGIESFKGHTFHTSRWDYAYTGGDAKGAPLTKLADKRVAHHRHRRHVGPVPSRTGPPRKQLYVFQRTPSSVDVRGNEPIDPEWFDAIASPAGSSAGWRTSPPTRPAAAPTRTW